MYKDKFSNDYYCGSDFIHLRKFLFVCDNAKELLSGGTLKRKKMLLRDEGI